MGNARETGQREPTYIGIGEDMSFSQGSLTLTALGTTLVNALDAVDTKDGRVNARLNTNIWRYLQDSPLLQGSLAANGSTAVGDMTTRLIKLRLYDHLRLYSCNHPTGVPWGVALPADVPRYFSLHEQVTDEWRVAGVTPRYLDESLQRNLGRLWVGGGWWSLDDPDLAVVVLDHAASNNQSVWAAQILSALPYPLLNVDEVFQCTSDEGVQAPRLCSMRRNECCVTLNNRVNKLLLVHTRERPALPVVGVEVRLAMPTAARDLPEVEDQPLDNLITACLGRLMNSAEPLHRVIEPYLTRILGSGTVCWDTINDIISWACFRYVPQPEVVRTEADEQHIHWLPEPYEQARFGTEIPRGRVRCNEAYDRDYYHDTSVTCTDNIFVLKPDADEFPALTVGKWPNVVELATGLGMALFNMPTEGGSAGVGRGTGLALDDVGRSLLRRRAFEEFKRANGLADQPVSPELMGEAEAFWDVIVYGEGDQGESIAGISRYILDLPTNSKLGWEANRLGVNVVPTFTGVRTPLALNLFECMQRGRYEVGEGAGFKQLSGLGDSWLNSRYAYEGWGTTSDVVVERGLMRINLTNIDGGDLILGTRPQQIAQHSYIHIYVFPST